MRRCVHRCSLKLLDVLSCGWSVCVRPPAQVPVYVGKIPPDCENPFLLSLLGTCGRVVKWRRTEDPDNGKARSFGLCDYDSVDSARRVSHVCLTHAVRGRSNMNAFPALHMQKDYS